MRIPVPVWIVSAETGYLLLEQKKFQNKSKNIDEVYQSVFFRCIMLLSYRVAFLCNVFLKLIIHQKTLYDIFFEKVVVDFEIYCGKINYWIRFCRKRLLGSS